MVSMAACGIAFSQSHTDRSISSAKDQSGRFQRYENDPLKLLSVSGIERSAGNDRDELESREDRRVRRLSLISLDGT